MIKLLYIGTYCYALMEASFSFKNTIGDRIYN